MKAIPADLGFSNARHLPQVSVRSNAPRPVVHCLPLPVFDDQELSAVRSAFSSVVPIALGQAWRDQVEACFSAGQVRIAWRAASLLVFAELHEPAANSQATTNNQRLWELGDSFEIFLQSSGHPGYIEFQIAPNNLVLQLRFPHHGAVVDLRQHGLERYLISEKACHSQSWVQASANRWWVYAEISAATLGETVQSLAGRQWRFSFCRYDYAADQIEPVLASTSPHAQPDFHRYEEWGIINFGLGT